MAAVSTNYGTAGDSTLENSASRSNGTKGSSKTGSGSGSGSNSNTAFRSLSQSRVQRKRAGTGTRPSRVTPAVNGSGSDSGLRQLENQRPRLDPSLCADTSPRAHGALGKSQKDGKSGRSDTVREPVRRSMFPLSAPRKDLSFQVPEKGKHGARAGSVGSPFATESDLIELVPRPHIRNASGTTERVHGGEGPDKMVIHKEIRYSIQYEDESELRREDLKVNSVDVCAYV